MNREHGSNHRFLKLSFSLIISLICTLTSHGDVDQFSALLGNLHRVLLDTLIFTLCPLDSSLQQFPNPLRIWPFSRGGALISHQGRILEGAAGWFPTLSYATSGNNVAQGNPLTLVLLLVENKA